MPKNFDSEYERLVAPLGKFGPALEQLVRNLLGAENVKFHDVSFRVKDKDSAERKVASKVGEDGGSRPLDSLTDLLGLRVITYFPDEVDAVAQLVGKEFAIDAENSVDKRVALGTDKFGYMSMHYVAELREDRAALAEYRPYGGIKFEIQIRSILQHAWAEIEHDLGYKSAATVPRNIKRRFSLLAAVLELADGEFLEIRQDIEKRQVTASKTIERGSLGIEIDQDSLYAFVDANKLIRELDQMIARSMNGVVRPGVDDEFMGRQAVRIGNLGFRSIEDLSNYLSEHLDLLRGFIAERLSLMRHTPRIGRTPVPRGITLHYLGLLRYAQYLQAGNPAAADPTYPGTSPESLLQSLRAATATLDAPRKAEPGEA
jgi:putative GTP pyrophosphokinase